MISGSAVIKTTKIGVSGERPNQIIAKIAQIADETVFITGRIGSKNAPRLRFDPSRVPPGTPVITGIVKPADTRPRVTIRLYGRSPLVVSSMMRLNTRAGL